MKSNASPFSSSIATTSLTSVLRLLLIAALWLPLRANAAGVAYFSRTTDTIQVSGQTVLGTTATFEAMILLPANGTGWGSVFNEWTDNAEDKRFYAGTNYLEGYGLLSRGSARTNVTITTGVWHHIAYVCDGAQQRLYLDGVLLTNIPASGSFDNASGLGFVGASPQGGLNPSFIGYLDSLRISSVARYAGASFSPPTGDLPTDASTLLLYNFNEPPGSTTVTDLSSNGRTGTVATGVPGATSPAFLTVPPDTSRGTALFSRTTDTIQVSGQTVLGTTATYEAVIFLPANSTGMGSVFNEWTDNLEDKRFYAGTNYLEGYGLLSRGAARTNVTITTGLWHHIAYVCDGVQQRLYLDGVLLTNISASGSFDNASGLGFVGASPQGGLNPSFIGYLDSLRISSVARYTGASFSPPTGDMTTDASTLLLYNFNEPAGSTTVTDLSGNGRTGTVATGVPGATAPGFLTVPPEASRGTALFSRTTDTIQVSGQTVLGTTTTYEAVILLPANGTSMGSVFNEWTDNLEDKRFYAGTNYLEGYGLLSQGSTRTNVTIAKGVWHHIAYVCDGVQQRLYLDGVLLTNIPASGSFANASGLGFVGASPQGGLNPSFIGYLDSLRISSVARYTGTSFFPPTGDMTTDANTLLLYNFNEPAGSTTVTDLSGNGRTGTVATGVPGATAPSFDGGYQPPLISEQPQSQTIQIGSTVTLSVGAFASPPVSYQWQFNGANIVGATGPTLVLSILSATNAGAYRVIVSNVGSSVPSQTASLLFFGDLKFVASTILAGPVGQQFRVDFADVLGGVTNWFTLANVSLPYSPYVVIDPDSRGRTNRYYRAVPLP